MKRQCGNHNGENGASINYNMRCIETELHPEWLKFKSAINYNMRCIETKVLTRHLTSDAEINYNMRCIETRALDILSKDTA